METIVREHVYDIDGVFDILFVSKRHHQNRKRREFAVYDVCHRRGIECRSRNGPITLLDFRRNIFQNRIC
jgi:hypothetical protein